MDNMRLLSLCIAITIFLLPITVSAINWEKGSFDIYLSSEGYYNYVRGNEEKSSLEQGWFYVENLILDLNHEFTDKIKFQGYTHFRNSNDSLHQIDEREWMFVEGYFRLYDEFYELWGGDYAEDYTPYTLSTSLLGAKGFYKYNDWIKVSALYGRNRDQDLDDYIQNTTGGRIELFYKEHLTLGGTFIYSDVERDSLRADSSLGDQFNQVFGGDLHLSLWSDRLHFDAEYARSIYNYDERDKTLRDQYGNAFLARGDISPRDNLTIRAEFERVEPWFYSTMGYASADVQRVKGEIEYAPWEMVSTMLFYEYSYDKIDKHSLAEHRTHTHLTSFSSTIYPFYKREDMWNSLAVDLMIDHSKYYTKDEPRTTDQDDLMVYGTVYQSFTHWNYSIGYTYSRNWNRTDDTCEYFSHTPTVSLGINYPWLALDWAWNFGGTYEYRQYILSRLIDRVYSGNAGLALSYERTKSSLSLTVAVEYYDNDPDPSLGFVDNISRSCSAVFDQVLWERNLFTANLTLSASYMHFDEDAYDQNYIEGVYYCGLKLTF
ncbi:MAG: hypothetical protein JXA50_10870 [Deltaproteobacteria bacterium]|nr:hypothetical protein [Deltaproteobacteria bacterium]